jgi:hypothetical protein
LKQHETIRTIIEDIVERQLRYNQPPETFQAYERLIKDESFTDEEARTLIGRTIQVELFRLMRFAEPFNQIRFIRNLQQLPDLPNVD